MKKILFTLFTLAFAITCHAQQINGSFMGLKMGFSSMEDAIEIFEARDIEYEVEDKYELSFSGRFSLENYWATEGLMLFRNDQLVFLMVGNEGCNSPLQDCRIVKYALKTKYQHLEDDYTNQWLLPLIEDEDLTVWAKTDGKQSVFYVHEEDILTWGYAIFTDKPLNSANNIFNSAPSVQPEIEDEDDVEVETIEINTEDDKDVEVVIAPPVEAPVEEEEEEVIFTVVEQMPEFPGGTSEMYKYISANLRYPIEAQNNGIQGRTICQFVVNKDGSVVDVVVVRSSGNDALDNEAIRLISSMPKWKPGTQRGKAVRVKYTVPVNFRLL